GEAPRIAVLSEVELAVQAARLRHQGHKISLDRDAGPRGNGIVHRGTNRFIERDVVRLVRDRLVNRLDPPVDRPLSDTGRWGPGRQENVVRHRHEGRSGGHDATPTELIASEGEVERRLYLDMRRGIAAKPVGPRPVRLDRGMDLPRRDA